MRRLLFLNTNLRIGGAERQLVHLARHLNPQQWRLNLLLLEGQGSFLADIPAHITLDTLFPQYPARFSSQVFWAARAAWALRGFLKNYSEEDIILTFLWLPTLLAALALRFHPSPPKLVWSVQGDLVYDFQHKPLGRWRQFFLKRWVPPAVRHYVAISSGVALSIQQVLGASSSQITHIPNAIDLESIIRLAQEEIPIRKTSDALWLVSVGRLARQKGYEDLIAAVARMRSEIASAVQFFIFGDGSERKRLLSLIHQYQLEDRMHLMGMTSNPYAWMHRADIFVHPARWEPFGIVLAEAMALGLPIITTETDGARDLIESHVNGIRVPSHDPDALSQAILQLIRAPQYRIALGRHAQQEARKFDATHIAQRYQQLLVNL